MAQMVVCETGLFVEPVLDPFVVHVSFGSLVRYQVVALLFVALVVVV